MMKSTFTICFLVTVLCAAEARELLVASAPPAVTTYTYSGPRSINHCPCSGKSKDGNNDFQGHWKMKNFRVDENNQMWCDGEVTGTWGSGRNKKRCDNHPMSWPMTVEYCGTSQFRSPGGTCSDWCNARSRSNSGPGCSSLINLPEVLNCKSTDLIGRNSQTCGASHCPLLSLRFGEPSGCDMSVNGADFKLGQIEVIVGGQDGGIFDELLCLVGNLLDIDGDKNHMCGVLNTWMGGCNNREKFSLLGEVGVAVEDILGDLGLTGHGGLLG